MIQKEVYQMTVSVTGFQKKKGSAFIALFRSGDEFPEFGKQFKGFIVPVTGESVEVIFKNLDPGKYAIAAYHDMNSNKRLDKNLFGAPLEPYGFSNNARSTFSPPAFSQAAFDLKKDRTITFQVR
jgi:uncharacterized protein (DUF2141 family)